MSSTRSDHWQAIIEAGLEAGQTPLLDLGVEPEIIASLSELVALHSLAAERIDVTAPVVVCSGNSLLWLAALLHQRAAPTPVRSPNLTVLYGGVDLATHMASLATLKRGKQLSTLRPAGELPVNFVPFFVHPGRLELIYGENLPWQVVGLHPPAPNWASSESLNAEKSWLTWSAILLLFLLILLAVVF